VSNPQSLTPGTDFFLAFSPERIDPGRTDWAVETTPKVIGGVTPTCLEMAKALYSQVIHTIVPVSSPGAAEMTMLLENTLRAVNIALVNEVRRALSSLNHQSNLGMGMRPGRLSMYQGECND
jgi:UDP-N-acetyl-D-glucosamine dehydrogenase